MTRSARTLAPLGTLRRPRTQIEPAIWRGKAWYRRAGQAFELGEPGLVDGATANSLAAGRYGPPRDGQLAKAKLPSGSCLRMLDQSRGCQTPTIWGCQTPTVWVARGCQTSVVRRGQF